MNLQPFIRDVPDFPRSGIVFRDITPLLASPDAFRVAIDGFAGLAESLAPDAIVAIESRGFWFGAPLAVRLRVPFIPVRKPGKLPHTTIRETYSLEYGTDSLEMHADALPAGARTLIVDDVLATGGTAAAVSCLVRRAGGVTVGALFLIELSALGGRARLEETPAHALITY